MLISATNMLGMNLLETLLFTPCGDLKIADDRCTRTLGNGDHVAHMIAVAVANEDIVRLYFFRRYRSSRILCQERIYDNFVSTSFETKCCMPIPGQFRRHKNLL